ncbi:MAG TPA: LytR C-terminal domain-containing protein [Acidimicrobiia bacterium]|nr:LytR C-terminal domain-containing protein [Acidimicrobiia bacterium]
MTNKGKHSSESSGTFYRDLAIMILGILLVGAAVFFILYLFADEPTTGPTTTTTTLATSTTAEDVTSTTGAGSTTSTNAPTSTTVAVRPPAEVTVVVLNSIGVDGAAGRMTQELAEAGYQTLTPDDFEPEQSPSKIWYREGFAAEAAALIEYIPDADVEPLPDSSVGEGADVVMVLGTGFTE